MRPAADCEMPSDEARKAIYGTYPLGEMAADRYWPDAADTLRIT